MEHREDTFRSRLETGFDRGSEWRRSFNKGVKLDACIVMENWSGLLACEAKERCFYIGCSNIAILDILFHISWHGEIIDETLSSFFWILQFIFIYRWFWLTRNKNENQEKKKCVITQRLNVDVFRTNSHWILIINNWKFFYSLSVFVLLWFQESCHLDFWRD